MERMTEVWLPCFLFPEIASRPDMEVEGDKRLDKLESFLDRLHSKGKQHELLLPACHCRARHNQSSVWHKFNVPQLNVSPFKLTTCTRD